MAEVTPNTDAAIDFLKRFCPNGPWKLTAFSVDQKSNAGTTCTTIEQLKQFLDENNGQRNVYFQHNRVKAGTKSKVKTKKIDISHVDYLHVDLDPRKGEPLLNEQKRIMAFIEAPPPGVPKPSFVIFSGGGYQFFWKLKDPIELQDDEKRVESAEKYNITFEHLFGTEDHCHNIDRVMRLPGTINLPDVKKQKAGRQPTLAVLMYMDEDLVYNLSDFPLSEEPTSSVKQGLTGDASQVVVPHVVINGMGVKVSDLNDLKKNIPAGSPNLPQEVEILIVQGNNPEFREKYPSRSEALFYVVCSMVRSGLSDDLIYGVITDPDFGISDSVLTNSNGTKRGDSHKYAIKQIQTARTSVVNTGKKIEDEILKYCALYPVILNVGGKTVVRVDKYNEVAKAYEDDFVSFDTFKDMMINQYTMIQGEPVKIAPWYLAHPRRKSYRAITFDPTGAVVDPDLYNLWHGMGVTARPGSCQKFWDHVYSNVCSKNQELYDYLRGWMAYCVKFPGMKTGVVIVLQGDQGTGKSFFASSLGRLFGAHYMTTGDPDQLTDKFNSHFRSCLLFFADEAFYAGDKANLSVLKALVTENSFMSQAKYRNSENANNMMNIIMASNKDWVIPAEKNERRFCVIAVSPTKRQEHEYFNEIQTELDNGGYEALMHDLLQMDLSNFNVRSFPRTEAVFEQIERSLGFEDEWWLDVLERQRLTFIEDVYLPKVQVADVYRDYVEFMKPNHGKLKSATHLGRFLRKNIPGLKVTQSPGKITATNVQRFSKTEQQQIIKANKPYYYIMPSFQEMRDEFNNKFFEGTRQWNPLPTPETESPVQEDIKEAKGSF